MKEMNKEDDQKVLEIIYITSEIANFSMSEGGFLTLILNKTDIYNKISLLRMFPLTAKDEYISVRDENNNEIGIIRNIYEFDNETVNLFKKELERRYFSPIIKKIISLKNEFSYTYWEVETTSGTIKFTVRNEGENVLMLKDNSIVIIDIDGNRYKIENYDDIELKDKKIIELLI